MSLVDDQVFIKSVEKIAYNVESDATLRQDLIQEGLIQVWKKEQSHPGQTRSWYLQASKYRMLNLSQRGRSIDSMKRRGQAIGFLGGDGEELLGYEDGFEIIKANDILSTLLAKLTQKDVEILQRLVEGQSVREISRQLQVTHPTILKHRQRIISIARNLELAA